MWIGAWCREFSVEIESEKGGKNFYNNHSSFAESLLLLLRWGLASHTSQQLTTRKTQKTIRRAEIKARSERTERNQTDDESRVQVAE